MKGARYHLFDAPTGLFGVLEDKISGARWVIPYGKCPVSLVTSPDDEPYRIVGVGEKEECRNAALLGISHD